MHITWNIITFFGSVPWVAAFSLFLVLVWYFKGQRAWWLAYAIGLAANEAVVESLKLLVHEPRPNGSGFDSFPSGHSAASMFLYGFLAFFIWKTRKNLSKNRWLAACAALILLIGMSRLALGVHYPWDVVSGYAVGLLSLILSTHFGGLTRERRE